jgi:hypothetical protein
MKAAAPRPIGNQTRHQQTRGALNGCAGQSNPVRRLLHNTSRQPTGYMIRFPFRCISWFHGHPAEHEPSQPNNPAWQPSAHLDPASIRWEK